MADIYREYYERKGGDRNDLLTNPEVLFQMLAFDRANIAALRKVKIDRSTARVLDVGCGNGASLLQFIRLGFNPDNLVGIDNSEERIADGRRLHPNMDFRCDSADRMPFADESFDLVFESTMLGTLSSMDLLSNIASEMIRVTRMGGHLMLADWRYSRKGSGVETAMSKKRVAELFRVGEKTKVIVRERGALVPPLGRRLSRMMPAMYFVVQKLLPPAAGHVTTILEKL